MHANIPFRSPDQSDWTRIDCPRCGGAGEVPGAGKLSGLYPPIKCVACGGLGICHISLSEISAKDLPRKIEPAKAPADPKGIIEELSWNTSWLLGILDDSEFESYQDPFKLGIRNLYQTVQWLSNNLALKTPLQVPPAPFRPFPPFAA